MVVLSSKVNNEAFAKPMLVKLARTVSVSCKVSEGSKAAFETTSTAGLKVDAFTATLKVRNV